jgi:hypothetical protein
MGARQAVLLTPSKSSYPFARPFYKHPELASPLFVILTKSAHLYHSTAFSRPLFSLTHSFAFTET